MMTEEILYARLKEALRDAIARHHLPCMVVTGRERSRSRSRAIVFCPGAASAREV